MVITIEDGVNGIIEDNFMASGTPTANYGTNIHLSANNYYSADGGQWALIKVDLSDYADMIPISGRFLARSSAANAAILPGKCTKLLKAWGEFTSTWNNHDTGQAWDIAGAQETTGETPDRHDTVESYFLASISNVFYIPITMPTLLEWLSGTNYGVVTDGDNATPGLYVHFGSSENTSVPIQFYFAYVEEVVGGSPLSTRSRMINL